jgi:very-short-patch-repair endonuclease
MERKKIGFKHTKETKKKISEYSKGFWKNPEYVKKVIESRERTRKERGYVNSPETREKISKIMKEKIKNGEFNPKKISPFVIGHKINIGRKTSDYQKKICGEKLKETRKHQIFPKIDTGIEIKIQNFLKQLNIDFLTHQYIKNIEHGYQCDILIPSMNLIIECDGNYWHKYPIGNEIDNIRTSELIKNGFKVLRLWEIDIKRMELNEFKEKLL